METTIEVGPPKQTRIEVIRSKLAGRIHGLTLAVGNMMGRNPSLVTAITSYPVKESAVKNINHEMVVTPELPFPTSSEERQEEVLAAYYKMLRLDISLDADGGFDRHFTDISEARKGETTQRIIVDLSAIGNHSQDFDEDKNALTPKTNKRKAILSELQNQFPNFQLRRLQGRLTPRELLEVVALNRGIYFRDNKGWGVPVLDTDGSDLQLNVTHYFLHTENKDGDRVRNGLAGMRSFWITPETNAPLLPSRSGLSIDNIKTSLEQYDTLLFRPDGTKGLNDDIRETYRTAYGDSAEQELAKIGIIFDPNVRYPSTVDQTAAILSEALTNKSVVNPMLNQLIRLMQGHKVRSSLTGELNDTFTIIERLTPLVYAKPDAFGLENDPRKQIVLAQQSVIELMCLGAAHSFIKGSNIWLLQHDKGFGDNLLEYFGAASMYKLAHIAQTRHDSAGNPIPDDCDLSIIDIELAMKYCAREGSLTMVNHCLDLISIEDPQLAETMKVNLQKEPRIASRMQAYEKFKDNSGIK